jgi:hypothetical protein
MEYRDRIVENEDVLLDGNVLTGCTFRKCRLIFKGLAKTTLGANVFEDCTLNLESRAALTVDALRKMHNGGMRAFSDSVIRHVRSDRP